MKNKNKRYKDSETQSVQYIVINHEYLNNFILYTKIIAFTYVIPLFQYIYNTLI